MDGLKLVIVIQGIRMSKSDCWTQVCPNSDTRDHG